MSRSRLPRNPCKPNLLEAGAEDVVEETVAAIEEATNAAVLIEVDTSAV